MYEVQVVRDDQADQTVAREIARTGSDTQRALAGWAMTSGVSVGGGTGGGSVYGGSPVQIIDNGDGTAEISVVGAGATLTPSVDGTYVTLTVGGTA